MEYNDTERFALLDGQLVEIERNGPEATIRLSHFQHAYLRKHGLVADVNEWWYHPQGAYGLKPHTNPHQKHRKRVNLVPVLTHVEAA